jgi:hypothetical protein
MKRRYILGGIAAAAVLVGGGVGLDAAGAYGGGQSGSPYGASSSAAPGAMTPSIGSAALGPGTGRRPPPGGRPGRGGDGRVTA